MNLFYSEDTGLSLNKLWTNKGKPHIEIVTPNGEGDLNISDIDQLIAALQFARDDSNTERTKELIALTKDIDVENIISIDIDSISNYVTGTIDIEYPNGKVEEQSFNVPRLA